MNLNELYLWCKHLRTRIADDSQFWGLDAETAVRLIQSCGENPSVAVVVDLIGMLDTGTLSVGKPESDPVALLMSALVSANACRLAVDLRSLDHNATVKHIDPVGQSQRWSITVTDFKYSTAIALINMNDMLVISSNKAPNNTIHLVVALSP